jgi:uncharacterized protein DUF5132
MALLDDALKSWGPSVLIGVGVALAAPIVVPALGSVLRPVAKEIIRGYLSLADKLREFSADMGEQLSDVVAEVQAERAATAAASVQAAEVGQGESTAP